MLSTINPLEYLILHLTVEKKIKFRTTWVWLTVKVWKCLEVNCPFYGILGPILGLNPNLYMNHITPNHTKPHK